MSCGYIDNPYNQKQNNHSPARQPIDISIDIPIDIIRNIVENVNMLL